MVMLRRIWGHLRDDQLTARDGDRRSLIVTRIRTRTRTRSVKSWGSYRKWRRADARLTVTQKACNRKPETGAEAGSGKVKAKAIAIAIAIRATFAFKCRSAVGWSCWGGPLLLPLPLPLLHLQRPSLRLLSSTTSTLQVRIPHLFSPALALTLTLILLPMTSMTRTTHNL